METQRLSILMERARGTYTRNEVIRALARQGVLNYAEIGRQFRISRQAVRAIVRRQNGNSR